MNYRFVAHNVMLVLATNVVLTLYNHEVGLFMLITCILYGTHIDHFPMSQAVGLKGDGYMAKYHYIMLLIIFMHLYHNSYSTEQL